MTWLNLRRLRLAKDSGESAILCARRGFAGLARIAARRAAHWALRAMEAK